MKQFKACFVGVGSIAKRHIKNLHTICEERGISLTVDAFRRSYEIMDAVDTVYTDVSCMPCDYDAIFITNPTDKHLESIRRFDGKGKHFFIEKPVVSLGQIKQAENVVLKEGYVYYVACPLRYNAVIRYLKEHLDPSKIISVRSISSSYLPDWRPGQDYRQVYSAHKDMGGGVSIDLIHEWDYLTYLFGWPENVKSFIGKKSRLEIDSDDYAIYIAEYEKMIAELHLDYFGRKTIREIEIFTNDETIIGDITNQTVRFMVSGEVIEFHEERDDYQKRELIYFLNMIDGKAPVENGFYHGLQVLKLTQGEC